jgi:hypothetical protein
VQTRGTIFEDCGSLMVPLIVAVVLVFFVLVCGGGIEMAIFEDHFPDN